MLDWNEYQKQIQKRMAEIGRTHHEVGTGYVN